jgi:hypothetical protein
VAIRAVQGLTDATSWATSPERFEPLTLLILDLISD